jgi:hypothetical protein
MQARPVLSARVAKVIQAAQAVPADRVALEAEAGPVVKAVRAAQAAKVVQADRAAQGAKVVQAVRAASVATAATAVVPVVKARPADSVEWAVVLAVRAPLADLADSVGSAVAWVRSVGSVQSEGWARSAAKVHRHRFHSPTVSKAAWNRRPPRDRCPSNSTLARAARRFHARVHRHPFAFSSS